MWTEVLLLAAGLALLAGFLAARVDRYRNSRAAVMEFTQSLSPPPQDSHNGTPDGDLEATPKEAALEEPANSSQEFDKSGATLAVLRIPGIHLEVPVLNGTNALTLNRGVGWIAGTARPGEAGNTGLAGHRDSFFRGLKAVKPGDAIEITARNGKFTYVVDQLRIVKPEDLSVLDPGLVPELTLVTCYPFYYVGNAPRRYIVTARLADGQSLPANVSASMGPSAAPGLMRSSQ